MARSVLHHKTKVKLSIVCSTKEADCEIKIDYVICLHDDEKVSFMNLWVCVAMNLVTRKWKILLGRFLVKCKAVARATEGFSNRFLIFLRNLIRNKESYFCRPNEGSTGSRLNSKNFLNLNGFSLFALQWSVQREESSQEKVHKKVNIEMLAKKGYEIFKLGIFLADTPEEVDVHVMNNNSPEWVTVKSNFAFSIKDSAEKCLWASVTWQSWVRFVWK